MKKIALCLTAAACAFCAFAFSACDASDGTEKEKTTPEVAGDYYLDLNDLGMNLTVYLNLSEYGEFKFSGTLEYSVDKGSGVFSKSGSEYLMSYSLVNNAQVTAADGYFSQFSVQENGSLLFTSEYVYYGSTHISTVAEDDENIHLIAKPITSDYEEPDTDTAFTTGVYTAEYEKEGATYYHSASFFGDGTYLHFVYTEADEGLIIFSETGTYSVVTNQLALVSNADTSSRNSCTVVSGTKLTLSVLATTAAGERENLDFEKTENSRRIAKLTGTVEGYDAELILYSDGSYSAAANGVNETGVVAINTANGTFKQYPDSLTDGTRGLTYVSTVPTGTLNKENGKLIMENVRLRISTVYTRYSATLTETEEN
ncbi:MAG: hypothetical protein K2O89_06960 [Clostridia bacterium]|nr:hypothetical protein [Clostridia bacterium]